MTERKDMGELLEAEWVPPKPTGNRAVVHLKVDIFIEVQETDSWQDMVEQAEDEARKRIVASKVFLPFRSTPEMIHDNTTVEQLAHRVTINPQRSW